MRAIVTNAVSIAVVRGAPMGSRVLLLLAMARFSPSAEALAGVAYAIAIAESVRIVAGGTLEIWAMRAIGLASGGEVGRTTCTMAVVKLLFALAGAAVAMTLTALTGNGGLALAALSGVFVLAGEAMAVAVNYRVARSTAALLVPISLSSALAASAGCVAALAAGWDPVWACAIVASAEVITAVYALARMRAERLLVAFPEMVARSRAVVREVIPLVAYGAVIALYSRLDAIVLNAYSPDAFATYTVAFRATQPFLFIFGAVALAVYASHATSLPHAPEVRRLRFRKTAASIVAVASVAALATYLGCAWLIASFVPKYADSLGALRILCVMMPVNVFNSIGMYALGGAGRFRVLVGVAILNLVSSAIFLWLLVPMYEAQGGALALLGSQVVNGIALLVLSVRPRPQTTPI